MEGDVLKLLELEALIQTEMAARAALPGAAPSSRRTTGSSFAGGGQHSDVSPELLAAIYAKRPDLALCQSNILHETAAAVAAETVISADPTTISFAICNALTDT